MSISELLGGYFASSYLLFPAWWPLCSSAAFETSSPRGCRLPYRSSTAGVKPSTPARFSPVRKPPKIRAASAHDFVWQGYTRAVVTRESEYFPEQRSRTARITWAAFGPPMNCQKRLPVPLNPWQVIAAQPPTLRSRTLTPRSNLKIPEENGHGNRGYRPQRG